MTLAIDHDVTVLDREVIKTLKAATSVSFHSRNGESYINAERKMKISIPCLHREYNYKSVTQKMISGFHSLSVPRLTEEWTTFLDLLRPGDKIQLYWEISACSTPNLDDMKWVGDKLSLVILRDGKKLHFMIATQVCPVTSSARMCRV